MYITHNSKLLDYGNETSPTISLSCIVLYCMQCTYIKGLLLILGMHVQRGLRYLVRVCVRLLPCFGYCAQQSTQQEVSMASAQYGK